MRNPLWYLIAVFLLVSCGEKKVETTESSVVSIHDIYALEALNGEKIDLEKFSKHPELEINLTENRIMGNDGCNNFSGAIKTYSEKVLVFGGLAGTRMACENMEDTNLINQNLGKVAIYKRKDLKLFLFDTGGREVLRYRKVD